MGMLCCRLSKRICISFTAVVVCFTVWIGVRTVLRDWVENDQIEEKLGKYLSFKTTAAVKKPETNPEKYKTMEEIQQERRTRVKDYCRSQGRNETIMGKDVFDTMVDEKHKLLYCATLKVSSTQLKRMMRNFGESQLLNHYSDKERRRVLDTHFKFMFVREPLERLLSAFIDKMYVVRDPMYRRMWGRAILKRYRPNATAEAIENCNDISFEEFVRFVVDGGWDPHWAQYHNWCKVCAVEYDFIGRFENLQEELPYVFIAAPGVQEIPKFTRPYEMNNTTLKVKMYYSELPKKLLLRLLKLFRPDYEIFGYPYPGPIFEQMLQEG